MNLCRSGSGILVAVSSVFFLATASLVITLFILSVNGSTIMDGNLKADSNKLTEIGLPKFDSEKLIIDTDAGVDDAVALFLALGYEAKQRDQQRNFSSGVIAITCVFGNTNVDNVAVNVLKILKTVHRLDIPVYRGASRSLLTTPPIEDFFGKDGLGDFVYPDPPHPKDYLMKDHAAIALVRLAAQYPRQITLLCLGPLTNVALATRLDPNFITNLKQIVILGGSTEGLGNVKPGVEFNFYVDPEANFIVFDSVNTTKNNMNPIVLVPWESIVKRNIISMKWRKEVLGSVSSPQIRLLNLAEREILSEEETREWHSADVLAAAITLDPSIVSQASACYNAIPETQGIRSRGSLFVDYTRTLEDAPCNVVIIERVDMQRYKMMLLSYLAQ